MFVFLWLKLEIRYVYFESVYYFQQRQMIHFSSLTLNARNTKETPITRYISYKWHYNRTSIMCCPILSIHPSINVFAYSKSGMGFLRVTANGHMIHGRRPNSRMTHSSSHADTCCAVLWLWTAWLFPFHLRHCTHNIKRKLTHKNTRLSKFSYPGYCTKGTRTEDRTSDTVCLGRIELHV